MATWTKLKSGEWGIRVEGKATAGQSVTVRKRDGSTSTVSVGKVIWTGNGVSLCTVGSERREPVGASRYGSYATIGQRQQARMERTGWTGCSCGSIEGNPRDSDCATCRFDGGD
jgi:hypothetical protein